MSPSSPMALSWIMKLQLVFLTEAIALIEATAAVQQLIHLACVS